MKTQVIQLDPHDDVISIRDKMDWAKTPRILLVYPPRSRILGRTLDLHMLQRHAFTLGAQLAIVSPSHDIRRAAQALGIPAYKKATRAQRENWVAGGAHAAPARRAPRPDLRQMRHEGFPVEPRWRNLLGVRLLFFSLAVLAVLVLLLLFFPSATVALTPATRLQSLSIAVSANPKDTTLTPAGSLPARLIFTVIEKSLTGPVTGSIIVPKTSATGLARFSNLTTTLAGIPSGTVVRTTGDPPVRFTTTTDAVLPAGVGETMDVPIRAVEAGSSGNLPAGTLVAIEGDLGTSLAVTNPNPTAGGTDSSAPVQTAGDRLRLYDALVSEILAQCKTVLPKSIAPGDVFFPGTLAAGQVFSETYFPADGQAGATLSLTLDLQCQAEYASAADVTTLAGMLLDRTLPVGFEPGSSAVTTAYASPPMTDSDGVTRWKMQAQRLLRARLDPLAVMQSVQGRTPGQAVRRLEGSLRLAAAPKIHLAPAWWPWLPVAPFRIAISIAG
ncbi:MAG: baseplate J/gp47 family protein [Anaerolineales bacterium]